MFLPPFQGKRYSGLVILATFTARVVLGAGRGKGLGTPTMNLDLAAVPQDLQEGIYACYATVEGKRELAAMHYGPRPVFKDTTSCEVHLLDRIVVHAPETLTVQVIAYLREVRDFPSTDALMAQIHRDIQDARAILKNA
jgi:riboflavin kinase / FMN adenylyltransferase